MQTGTNRWLPGSKLRCRKAYIHTSTYFIMTELLNAFAHHLHNRLSAYLGHTAFTPDPGFQKELAKFTSAYETLQLLTEQESMILLLALIPHVQPNFFEKIILEHFPNGGEFPEFGGVRGSNHRSMLPTGETAQFMLAGNDLQQRLEVKRILLPGRVLYEEGIVWLEPVKEGEPIMSGRLIIDEEWVEKILLGRESAPRFGPEFPAKRISSRMEWEDAVLSPITMQQVQDIGSWLAHQPKIAKDENLKRKIKPGYRVLFYGPPGTGKTLTAVLLGKQFSKDVYRIDLSQVVSKYIGETEKNLERIFQKAERKDWILFFDEADALFGKRTQASNANDRYANQEVSYLLQRIEDFPGLLILASNFKNNLDDAFIRRFHAIVHFPLPSVQERLLLWQKSVPEGMPLAKDVQLKELAARYEMTGAAILNAVHFAVLQTHAIRGKELTLAALTDGIRKEFMKEEKSF